MGDPHPESVCADVEAERSTRLADLFARGASWKIGSQSLSQVLRLATTIVLAHLIAPGDYGLAAMALVLSAFAIAFSDLGFGAAIVQRPVLSQVDISTAFWISIAAGAVFSALAAALAGPLAAAYGHPPVRALILGLSPIFLLDSLATTQRALLARAVDFRSLELRTLVGVAAGAVCAIAAATQGAGAWSLIVQELVAAACGMLLLWRISPWRPTLSLSVSSIRDLGGFAVCKASSRFLADVNDTADNVLVGRFLGAAPLAIYALAYKTALRPMANVVAPLQEVLFPVLSRAQDDVRRVGDAWLRVTRLTSAVCLPLLAGIAVVAAEFVRVVLGPKWSAAAGVLQILVVVGAVQALSGASGSILAALDKMKLALRLSAARTALNVAAFVVGLHWGMRGVAVAYAVSSLLMFVPTIVFTTRSVDRGAGAFLRAISGPVQATIAMVVVLLLLRQLLISEHVGPAARLGLLVLCGAAVYVAGVSWRDRSLRRDVRGVALSLLGRRGEPVTIG